MSNGSIQDLPLFRFSTTPTHIHHTIRPVPSGSAAAGPATGLSGDLTTVAVVQVLWATDVSRRLVWARQPTHSTDVVKTHVQTPLLAG